MGVVFVLSSRGLCHGIMKEQQQKSSVTKKLSTTVDMKSGSVSRPQRGTKRGSGTGQPHAGQGGDATRVRKQLVSEMDTPRQQEEISIGHSEHLRSSPSVLCNTQHPVRGHKRRSAPRGKRGGLSTAPHTAARSGSNAGEPGELRFQPTRACRGAQRHSGTPPPGSRHLASAQLCTLSKRGLLLN